MRPCLIRDSGSNVYQKQLGLEGNRRGKYCGAISRSGQAVAGRLLQSHFWKYTKPQIYCMWLPGYRSLARVGRLISWN